MKPLVALRYEYMSFDNEVRLNLYREFVRSARAPSIASLAELMHKPLEEIRAAMERLAAGKVIVLQPESRELMIALPLPATGIVHFGTPARKWWDNIVFS